MEALMFYLLTPSGRLSRAKSKELFQIVLRQSRQAFLYETYKVPDTIEGRFEMVTLYGGILVNRLCRPDMGREGKMLAQAFFDVMFQNIDWSMRERGVGDLAVPHRIKKMMSDFKGRSLAYDEACRSGPSELTHALVRNVYGANSKPTLEILQQFVRYIQECTADLEKKGLSDFWSGRLSYPSFLYNTNQNGSRDYATQAA